jgi:hypothetical protein
MVVPDSQASEVFHEKPSSPIFVLRAPACCRHHARVRLLKPAAAISDGNSRDSHSAKRRVPIHSDGLLQFVAYQGDAPHSNLGRVLPASPYKQCLAQRSRVGAMRCGREWHLYGLGV